LLILALVGSAHAAEVRGRVVDRSGNAIPDAQVTLRTTGGVRTSLTDQTGTFAFPEADGATSVIAVAQGFAPQAIEVSSPSELTITLQAAGAREVVVVTPDRGSAELAQTPASVSVIDQAQLESSGAITLDQKLRVIPGFTLFRRTGSLAANPTAQGVSLRGVGGSGASRALVAKDGIPLNDPFGGWVYWTREPSLAIESVEVVRGGFSHLYGSDALSGVINVLPSEPTTNQLLVDASYGGYNTGDLSLLASGAAKHWRGTFIGEVFDTDGYI
jgi:outer membrane cobalamin receptor